MNKGGAWWVVRVGLLMVFEVLEEEHLCGERAGQRSKSCQVCCGSGQETRVTLTALERNRK